MPMWAGTAAEPLSVLAQGYCLYPVRKALQPVGTAYPGRPEAVPVFRLYAPGADPQMKTCQK
jgi:hypothetical protein